MTPISSRIEPEKLGNENFFAYCNKIGFTKKDISDSPILSIKEVAFFQNHDHLELETLQKFSIHFGFPKDYFYSPNFTLPLTTKDVISSMDNLGGLIHKQEALTLYLSQMATRISKHPELHKLPKTHTFEDRFLADNHAYTNETVALEIINDLNKILQKLTRKAESNF